MKKVKFIFALILLIASYNLKAQVGINTDGSSSDASAMLDVKSTEKGMLIPRMTLSEIATITSPADGLQAYNTDEGKLYIYVLGDNRWKEVQYGSGEIIPSATYTIGTGGSCANTTANGNYYQGFALISSNTVILDATITRPGTWSMLTNTINGYSFSGNGTFTSTGTVQVTLDGTGTPTTDQTDNFIVTANTNTSTCNFNIMVLAEPVLASDEVFNPLTGMIWKDRNLGASQVATSSNDAAAYGDLYQWGRATEGHEDRSSITTDQIANTAVPNASNTWDSLFIIKSLSQNPPYDWLSPMDNTLWQGESGTNNVCPTGFRLPTLTEWDAERASWATFDAAGAFGSPLKLTLGGFRNPNSGFIGDAGIHGKYWSSSVDGANASYLYFHSSFAFPFSDQRANGFSVRCIKD